MKTHILKQQDRKKIAPRIMWREQHVLHSTGEQVVPHAAQLCPEARHGVQGELHGELPRHGDHAVVRERDLVA